MSACALCHLCTECARVESTVVVCVAFALCCAGACGERDLVPEAHGRGGVLARDCLAPDPRHLCVRSCACVRALSCACVCAVERSRHKP